MDIFKKMGPRVILIDYHGRLTGLVTIKDCLKFQFKVEAQDQPQNGSGAGGNWDEGGEKLWGVIRSVARWADAKVDVIRRAVGLGSRRGDIALMSPIGSRIDSRDNERSEGGRRGDGVELEDRVRG